jgi:hypothetical protein
VAAVWCPSGRLRGDDASKRWTLVLLAGEGYAYVAMPAWSIGPWHFRQGLTPSQGFGATPA